MLGYSRNVYFCCLKNVIRDSSGVISLLLRKPISLSHSCPFWGRPPFVLTDMHNFACYVMSFRATCCMFTILQLTYFVFTIFFQHSFSFWDCLSCSRVKSPCYFLFLNWLSLHMLHLITGFFYFQASAFPLSCSGNCFRFYAQGLYHLARTPGCCIYAM